MAPSKKSPRKSAKLKTLKPNSVRKSVATRVKGGAEPINDRKGPRSLQ